MKVLNLLSHTSLITAFYSAILTFFSELTLKGQYSNLVYINFLATLIGYNLISLVALNNRITSGRMYWQKNNQTLLITLTALSAISLIFFLLNLDLIQLIILSHLFIIIFFYENNSTRMISLRSKIYLKPFIIAYIWSISCSFLIQPEIKTSTTILWAEVFLSILSLSLIYDIRDQQYDSKNNFSTLVHKYGTKKIKAFAIRSFIISLFLRMSFFPFKDFWGIYLLEICLFLLFTFKVHSGSSRSILVFLVDGLILLRLLYLL